MYVPIVLGLKFEGLTLNPYFSANFALLWFDQSFKKYWSQIALIPFSQCCLGHKAIHFEVAGIV